MLRFDKAIYLLLLYSGILMRVCQYERPNSGAQKNKKDVTVLLIISSSND